MIFSGQLVIAVHWARGWTRWPPGGPLCFILLWSKSARKVQRNFSRSPLRAHTYTHQQREKSNRASNTNSFSRYSAIKVKLLWSPQAFETWRRVEYRSLRKIVPVLFTFKFLVLSPYKILVSLWKPPAVCRSNYQLPPSSSLNHFFSFNCFPFLWACILSNSTSWHYLGFVSILSGTCHLV